MLYKYIGQGLLHRVIPPGYTKQGFYPEPEVEALAQSLQTFFEAGMPPAAVDAVFAHATEEDMPALVEQAHKHFPRTIDADLRRAWLRREPRGNYLLKRRDGSVAAYCYLQAIVLEKLLAYQEGALRGWQIAPEDVLAWVPGQPLDLMIGGIAAEPGPRQQHYTAVLLRGIIGDLEHLGRQGFIFRRIYAYSSTLQGIAMCNWLGMRQWKPPAGKRCTFVLEVEESPSFLLAGYKRGLSAWRVAQPAPPVETPAPAAPSPVLSRTPAPRTSRAAPSPPGRREPLPADLVTWRAFAKRHHIAESTVHKAIHGSRRLPVVVGNWIAGKAPVREALDAVGRRRFFEEYATAAHPEFVRCSECPHGAAQP